MGLLRSGSQLRLRRVYTEQSECARNDHVNLFKMFTINPFSLSQIFQ